MYTKPTLSVSFGRNALQLVGYRSIKEHPEWGLIAGTACAST